MNKKELLDLLDESNYSGERKDISDAVKRIKDTLAAVSDSADLGDIASVKEFKEKGGFKGFKMPTSRLDDDTHKQEIIKLLESIRLELLTWIRNNAHSIGMNALMTINKKTKKWMYCFLGVIVVLAACAIVCTVLHIFLGERFAWGEQVAEIIGALDFVLGVVAFVIERRDDMKKKELSATVEDVAHSGDNTKTEKLVQIVKKVTIKVIKNSRNKVKVESGAIVIIGDGNNTNGEDRQNEQHGR